MRTKKAFTLIEMMAVVVLIGVLTTGAVASYQSSIEGAKAKSCAANQQLLKTALDLYAMEHDTMPASLSAIPERYKQRAYAKVMRGADGWMIRLARKFIEADGTGRAYAESFVRILAKGSLRTITCPSDPTPPDNNAVSTASSYALNTHLISRGRANGPISTRHYRSLSSSTVLIIDSDVDGFSPDADIPMVCRHGRTIFSNEGSGNLITADGEVHKARRSETTSIRNHFRFDIPTDPDA